MPPSRANTSSILTAVNTAQPSAFGSSPAALDQVGDPDAELAVDDDDLAAGDEAAVDQDVDGGVGGAVELQDGAGLEAQQVPQRHAQAADLDGHLDRDVGEQREVAGRHHAVGSSRHTGWPGRGRAAAGRGPR